MTPQEVPGSRFVAERLLATIREEVGRADTKASVLLSAALAVPALLAPPLATRTTGMPPVAQALLAVGAALWVLGTAALVKVVLPRLDTSRARPGVTYFADLLAVDDAEQLAARVAAAGSDPVGWLLVQSTDVSRILGAKYRWLRRGVGCLAPGAFLGALGALLSDTSLLR